MGYVINYEDIAQMYDSRRSGKFGLQLKLTAIRDEMQKFVDNDNFSGESVMKIKEYFTDIQIPVIKAIIRAYLAFPSYIIKMLDALFEVEANPNARLNEEYLNGISDKLQDAIDVLLDIGTDVNAGIDMISGIMDLYRIKAEAFTNPGFTYLQDKVDELNQKIKNADDSYCNGELKNLENLISSVTSIVDKMAHTGAVDILKDDFATVFPLDDISNLENCVKAVCEDENQAYTDYLRRLCDAKDSYDEENKKVDFWQNIKNVTGNTAFISKCGVNVAVDVAELMFWLPEYAGEKYIYKWEDREFYEWICNYVPSHISDGSVIYAMTLLSPPLDDETIRNHLIYNRINWKNHMSDKHFLVDGYIDNQHSLKDMYYGVDGGPKTADGNSCEIVALYNALYSLNHGVDSSKHDFPELIAQIEANGPCINGIWGTSPFIIMCYLQDEGYKVKLYDGKKARKEKNIQALERDYDTYIVTVYNDKNDVNAMIHTMCITKTEMDGKEKYNIWNTLDDNKIEPQDSISDCLNAYENGNSQTICIMGVSK